MEPTTKRYVVGIRSLILDVEQRICGKEHHFTFRDPGISYVFKCCLTADSTHAPYGTSPKDMLDWAIDCYVGDAVCIEEL